MKIVQQISICFFVLPLLASGQIAVTNQRLFDTIPNMPVHYEKRVAKFKAEPVITGKIIFLGNSITEMGKWPQLLGDTTVVGVLAWIFRMQ